MARKGIWEKWILVLMVIPHFACVKAPIEMTMKNTIEITEQEVRDISNNIHKHLADIDFSHPSGSPAGMIDPQECSTHYKKWLRKQFDIGLVPRGMITPLEYARTSDNPLIGQCKTLNFDHEYENAAYKGMNDSKREAVIFDLSEIRDVVGSNNCSQNFTDPDQDKIAIASMHVSVLRNTLSVSAPKFKIYTSDEEFLQEELEEPDAETNLLREEVISALGETRQIPRRFLGKMPVDFTTDQEDFEYAAFPLITVTGSLLTIPGVLVGKPEIRKVAGKEYYIVPKGSLLLALGLHIELKITPSDVKCSYQRFKDSVEDEEN